MVPAAPCFRGGGLFRSGMQSPTGAAATAAQMEKAARAADNVVFAFDGDDAGRAAAWRALEGIIPALRDGKSVSFLFLPSGEDPDSFIQKRGAGAFETLLGGGEVVGGVCGGAAAGKRGGGDG